MAPTTDATTTRAATERPAFREPPKRELSWARVMVLIAVIAAIGAGVWQLVTQSPAGADAASTALTVYAPYVDATITPTYQFQQAAENPVSSVYLGFVVSDPHSPCTPSWGGYYSLTAADQTLNLDARIAQLSRQGGSAAVSFGGRANNELAVACSDQAALRQAYMAPVARYHLSTIDLDVEGAGLGDPAANARRAGAIAWVQRQRARQGHRLAVWVTLPVSVTGLDEPAIAVVSALLRAHVNVAGVNVMTMDFGVPTPRGGLWQTIRHAIFATHAQIESIWRRAGQNVGPAFAWAHLGVTPMLGVNDTPGERFTIADARQLVALAGREGIARISAWSLNRDYECGSTFPQTGLLSNTCSGVLQSQLEFTRIFSAARGTKTARPRAGGGGPGTQPGRTIVDNPATSPYPVWESSAAYVAGYKVVWQGQIYSANWWSQGTAPDSATGGPWLLIGPVPAGSVAPKPTLLVALPSASWSPDSVYRAGQQVSFDGLPFVARWYTHGNQPIAALPGNPNSPWQPLYTVPGEPSDSGHGSGVGA